MLIGKDFSILEERINYRFKNKSLLQNALTHSSFYNENRKNPKTTPSNERLEFLGDSILQIVISEYVFLEFPDKDEGALTKMRQHTVIRIIERTKGGAMIAINSAVGMLNFE